MFSGGSAQDSQPQATAVSTQSAPAVALPRLPGAPRVQVHDGFRAEVYARGVQAPTAMAFGPDGRLYVTQEDGKIVSLGRGARRARLLASDFPTPLGLTWRNRTLYVSAQGRIERLRVTGGRVTARRTIVADLPFGRHQQDTIVFGPDGRLYLGSGSTCDACAEGDARSAAVLSFRPDGSDLRIVSTGLRNPFGLAFQPRTGRLYVSVNNRDDLPDPSAPEPAETVVVAAPGRDFGWPDCWPSFRRKQLVGPCAGVTRPVAYLEPHSSADGLVFYTGRSFPARFRGSLFVALWGQYAAEEHGRRVVRLILGRDGSVKSTTTFASGFDHPLALTVDGLGGLLIGDWGRGVIYRIQAKGKP
jgi:glucose/arabinose dehydrogenase